ncbi:MAG: hypothetical protein QF570_02825 [Myxococcota bacterium]|jgi:hypothetical protein|nr:hypothetical protein [Myxococcota bacterium]
MKSRPLALFSGTLTLGLGYWLAESSRDAREIGVALIAWVLGFWFASNLLGEPPAASEVASSADDTDEYGDDGYEDDEYE